MFDICHPTYYNMSQLGCTDQVKLTTAFYVYMELCEVKRYWDVEYKYSEALQLFYLEAKKSKNAVANTFIPWPAIHNVTLDFISNIQHELEKDKLTFVFKEGDTTSVYYSVSSGIKRPINPEDTKIVKLKEERKFELEKEITRNTAYLYERALSLDNDNNEKISECSHNVTQEERDGEGFRTLVDVHLEQTESLELSATSSDSKALASNQNSNNVSNSEKLDSNENTNNVEETETAKVSNTIESAEINEKSEKLNDV